VRVTAPPVTPDSADTAEDAAVRILRSAGQSAASLRQKLERRGYTAEAAGEAVRRCVASGYVDDAAMAASVAARHRRAGHGRARVAADLRAKGVAAELISEALDGQNDTEEASALAVARQLWERSASSGTRDQRARMRVAGALQRRGFSASLISRVLRGLT
jgi:regulatory protein